jgi:hypothetical protein
MIPPFDENGYLPPGIHSANLKEIEKRFAYTPVRKRLFAGFVRLAKALKTAGCTTLYLNGSYITEKADPRDYDAVWEPDEVGNKIDKVLRDGTIVEIKRKYLGDIFCRMPIILARDHLEYFRTDRDGRVKGIIKMDLRQLI